MTETNEALAALTDATITAASGDELRRLAAEVGMTGYDVRTSVFTIEIGTELTSTAGALTAVDKMISALLRAYSDRGPEVVQRYGGTTEIRVWNEDDSIRQSIKWARDREIQKAELAGTANE